MDRGFVIPRFSTPRLLLVNGCPRDACGREAAGRAPRDADARGKDAGVAHLSHARATRARARLSPRSRVVEQRIEKQRAAAVVVLQRNFKSWLIRMRWAHLRNVHNALRLHRW